MGEPTREEMVEKIEEWKDGCGEGLPDNKSFCIACSGSKECDAMLQAIRKILTESDLAHWMDRCHELEAKLAEKPEPVSREWIIRTSAHLVNRFNRECRLSVTQQNGIYHILTEKGDLEDILTELGFKVEEE